MSLSRIVLYGVVVTLVLLLGTTILAYYNLPLLVEQQLKSQLRGLGVQTLRYQHIEVTHETLRVDTLVLSGVAGGVAYDATMSGITVSYHWQSLLAGKLGAVAMTSLELAITGSQVQLPATSAPAAEIKLSRWIPAASPPALPMESLDIQRWDLSIVSTGNSPFAASGKLHWKQQLKFYFESFYGDSPLTASIWTEGQNSMPRAQFQLGQGDTLAARLSATARLADAGRWHWRLRGELDFAPLLSWLRGMQQQGTAFKLKHLDKLKLVGASSINGHMSHGDELQLSQRSGQQLLRQLTVDASSNNRIERLDYAGALSQLRGDIPVAINISAGQLKARIGASGLQATLRTEVLGLSSSTRDWLGWGDSVPLRWYNTNDIDILPRQHQSWPLRLRDNRLVIGNRVSQLQLDGVQLDATIDPAAGLIATANLRTSVDLVLQQQQIPPLHLVLAYSGVPALAEFSAVLNDVPQSMNLVLRAEGDLRHGRVRLRSVLESQDLAQASTRVLPLLNQFGWLGKRQKTLITAGSMQLDTEFRSRAYSLDQLEQRSYLALEQLSGQYQGFPFDGLGLSADWSGVEQWRTTRPVRLFMARLNTGIELRNITARWSLPVATPIAKPKISIDSFAGQILGGWLVLPQPSPWDFGATSNSLTLKVERWQLANLLALQQKQDIQADGVVEGELPLTLSGGRVMITDGYLRALAPGGRIKYRANAATRSMAADSQELQRALDLLADFHYQKLASEVQLDAAGKLLLALSLAGNNPGQYQGKAVDFNINLEQNIDPLLQSLRLSGKLVDELEQRAQ